MKLNMHHILRATVSFIVLAALVGCAAPVRSADYTKFSMSLSSLHTTSHGLMDLAVEWAADGYVEGTPLDSDVSFDDMQIEFEPPFGYTLDGEPFYTLVADLQDALEEYTLAMSQYAELLSTLAGGSGADRERIQGLAASLNTNLGEAGKALNNFIEGRGGTPVTLSSQATGFVSVILAGGLDMQVEAKRRAALRRVMERGQLVVDDFALMAARATEVAAGDVGTTYLSWYRLQSRSYANNEREIRRLEAKRLASTSEGPALTADEIRILEELAAIQRSHRRALVDRNVAVSRSLESLKKIHQAVSKLPAAHQALRTQLETKPKPFEALQQLYDDVRRLEALYRKLSKDE